MPIYEYEPDDRPCFICDGRVAAIQAVGDPPLEWCPTCGLGVRRVISRAAFKVDKGLKPGERGFATYRKAESGVWEKIDGPGQDMIFRPTEDGES